MTAAAAVSTLLLRVSAAAAVYACYVFPTPQSGQKAWVAEDACL